MATADRAPKSSRKRCAIYTRKSTEEGLEQAFNSLDAQREACEAYIRSQAGEGWRTLADRYDDGGHSGGTMERPGLNRLLGDIAEGRIDIVVVYKVDRLTRSLSDFARMVEVFDTRNVSFVSVTQAFNTTTSMGRLTLNVLLSFAQFEREVTAERIRDKVLASKQKGLWMGGVVPIGYDLVDKKLIPNPEEAFAVNKLFAVYLEEASIAATRDRANREGLRTKQRSREDRPGGKPFTAGHLHQLLQNPIYLGKVRHRGVVYEGQHEAIVEQKIFAAIGEQLRQRRPTRSPGRKATPHRLTGLVYDETGDRLSPSYAIRSERRYHYYVSRRILNGRKGHADEGWRIPAHVLEGAVTEALATLLKDPKRLLNDLGAEANAIEMEQITSAALTIADELQSQQPDETPCPLASVVQRVDLASDRLSVQLHHDSLLRLLFGPTEQWCSPQRAQSDADNIEITIPWSVRRRGLQKRLVLGGKMQGEPDPALIDLLRRAHRTLGLLTGGGANSIEEAAQTLKLDRIEVSRVLPLAFLAPDITKAIFEGSQPPELTARSLARTSPLPLEWSAQRRVLGFPPI